MKTESATTELGTSATTSPDSRALHTYELSGADGDTENNKGAHAQTMALEICGNDEGTAKFQAKFLGGNRVAKGFAYVRYSRFLFFVEIAD